MQLINILRGIRDAQRTQDSEGGAHPGQTAAYVFDMSLLSAILLRCLGVRVEFVGCFKPRKPDASVQSTHP